MATLTLKLSLDCLADGCSRFHLAGILVGNGELSEASTLLEEAMTIFIEKHGPDHQYTVTARERIKSLKHKAGQG
jgi:hypothetical protein